LWDAAPGRRRFLLISYFSIASSVRAWSVIFYALALFFNYPHYMATIYRAYHRAEDFHKYRIFTFTSQRLIALTLVLSHSWFGFCRGFSQSI